MDETTRRSFEGAVARHKKELSQQAAPDVASKEWVKERIGSRITPLFQAHGFKKGRTHLSVLHPRQVEGGDEALGGG